MSDESTAAASVDTGGAEGGAAVAPANDNAQPETPAQRKWRLKYEGQEREIDSEDELITLAQKGLGADRRFEEAAAQRKEAAAERAKIHSDAQRFVERLTDDPIAALAALHGDEGKSAQRVAQAAIRNPRVRAQVEAMLLEAYEYEGLPEEQRREIDHKRELEAKASRVDEYEARERQAAAEAEKRERQAAFEQKRDAYQEVFAEEMRSSLTAVGLDPSDRDVAERWILDRMAAGQRGEELSAADAARGVAERMRGSRKGWLEGLGKLKGDALLAEIPAPVLAAIRAADVARVKGKQVDRSRAAQAGPGGARRPASKPRVEVTTDRWVRAVRELGLDEANRRMDAGEPLDR